MRIHSRWMILNLSTSIGRWVSQLCRLRTTWHRPSPRPRMQEPCITRRKAIETFKSTRFQLTTCRSGTQVCIQTSTKSCTSKTKSTKAKSTLNFCLFKSTPLTKPWLLDNQCSRSPRSQTTAIARPGPSPSNVTPSVTCLVRWQPTQALGTPWALQRMQILIL